MCHLYRRKDWSVIYADAFGNKLAIRQRINFYKENGEENCAYGKKYEGRDFTEGKE